MGYFNYFIKCIIRNIAYKLCKPKVFLTVLLCVIVLFSLHSIGYCAEWGDEEWLDLVRMLTVFRQSLDRIEFINEDIYDTLNSQLNDIQLKLNKSTFNYEEILKELEQISQALYGSVYKQKVDFNFSNRSLSIDSSGTYFNSGSDLWCVSSYDNTNDYELIINNGTGADFDFQVALTVDNIVSTSYAPAILLVNVKVPAYSTYTYLIGSGYSNVKYINFHALPSNLTIELYKVVKDGGLLGNVEDLNNSMAENNQLQQEQNQLQQEQNDILTNDEVNTDNLQFATDDTVNPTSDGFNTLFNTVYNAFCNTSSEPLTITLPYINETFTINPNIVSNGMKKAGLGVVVNLINSFYYFSVCLFIYKDINKIIDNLKSGNITADCGNVKTEVL